MKQLWQWLDGRTGCVRWARSFLFETIPGGPRWRHCWGKALLYTFFVQVITGIILWTGYSPSAQTAWESVYFIQNQMPFGWFLRGVHHFCAQAFVVMLVVHLLQMIFCKAYRAPREIQFWILLLLLPCAIAISATGWLLPFDQGGYWASRVSLNIASSMPVLGPMLKRLALGGAEIGHLTLTRFFALHAGVFPLTIGTLLLVHFTLLRRHGWPTSTDSGRPSSYWPNQFLRDAMVCALIAGTITALILLPRMTDPQAQPGIGLGAPADPSEQYSAARPEWFMLFLFQFLKLGILKQVFGSQGEFVGAFVIPGLLLVALFAMPFVARNARGHAFNLTLVSLLGLAIAGLILTALHDDANDANYHQAVADARRLAERTRVLAQSPEGIPPTGALSLLQNDPLTQGPELFSRHCASCHRFNGQDGLRRTPKDVQSASDLAGFASRRWIAGLLDPNQISTTNYFGGTAHANGKMVKNLKRDTAKYGESEKSELKKLVIALSAEARLKSQAEADRRDENIIQDGRKAIGDLGCTDCHQYHGQNSDVSAPDLTGYGSAEWLRGFISDVSHSRFYGKDNDRMPAFGSKGILTDHEISLLASWLRGDWYEPDDQLAASRH